MGHRQATKSFKDHHQPLNKATVGKFLDALAEAGIVQRACQVANVSRTAVYAKKKEDQEFADKWSEALVIAKENHEAELYRRGVIGVDEPVFYRGEECGHVRRYSDNLLMMRMKRLDPSYRDRVQVDGSVGVHDQREAVDALKNLSTEDLEALQAILAKARREDG